MNSPETLRFRNPFREATSTELIENPRSFSTLFSQEILVNETLDVFEKDNIILRGPQGTGKTMILCLFRHRFLSECLSKRKDAMFLKVIAPFCGISIHLIQSGFHVFGRRSISRARGRDSSDPELDAMCAADFIVHWLFREFVMHLQFLEGDQGALLRDWLGIGHRTLQLSDMAREMSSWDCWRGYYLGHDSLSALMARSGERLNAWHDLLNANIDDVPDEVWSTKATPFEDAMRAMGQVAGRLNPDRQIPLYVVIDQYEELPNLNPKYGTQLQRVVNTLVKRRDSGVFYKIGARPHDWGRELRVWGSESRIEIDRDYKIVDLTSILQKGENKADWLFPKFAEDVAFRRLKWLEADMDVRPDHIRTLFGSWDADEESRLYGLDKRPERGTDLLFRGMPKQYWEAVKLRCGADASPLELRLAAAWVQQRYQRFDSEKDILEGIGTSPAPWQRESWRKERREIALLQIASFANQRKKYYGWETIKYLSGSDIRAFLRICEEVWEMAAKVDPSQLLSRAAIRRELQTEGIFEASHYWRLRDRGEEAGGRRFAVIGRVGPAIHDALMQDTAISNPGHTGFSVSESDLHRDQNAEKVAAFLGIANNLAMFEERMHTSKERDGTTRSKWFLHPVLSPAFGIPIRRVKEPYYATVERIYEWLFTDAPVRFSSLAKRRSRRSRMSGDSGQMEFPLEGPP